MPSKSKTKGNNFELKVSKFFSKLYNESFTRTPTSGALVGGKNSKKNFSKEQVLFFRSDVIPPDNKWKFFCCECKHYKSFNDSSFVTWIDQININQEIDNFNFIIYNINYKGINIAFDYKETKNFNLNLKKPIIIYPYKNTKWIICDMYDFFEYNKINFKDRCFGINKSLYFDYSTIH